MEDLTENNRLIAEFMELPTEIFSSGRLNYGINEAWYELEELSFNIDWNWLMEVVNRIKQVGKEELKFSVEFQLAILTTNKETIYNECLEFIKWYNEQK